MAARTGADLEGVAADVRRAGGVVTAVVCDITRAEERAALVEAARGVGPIAVLVNNAGVEVAVSVVDHSASDVEREIAVNLLSPIQLTRLVLPGMIERGDGAIVMLSSMSGKSPTPYNAVYAATKHGLNGFTASLRIELNGTGVHAGVVCPSFVAGSGMWADTGLAAPAMLREVSIEAVVAGVRRAIDGAPEVLVTPTPVRPMLALGQLLPSLDAFLLRRLGVLDVLRARADHAMERRDEGTGGR